MKLFMKRLSVLLLVLSLAAVWYPAIPVLAKATGNSKESAIAMKMDGKDTKVTLSNGQEKFYIMNLTKPGKVKFTLKSKEKGTSINLDISDGSGTQLLNQTSAYNEDKGSTTLTNSKYYQKGFYYIRVTSNSLKGKQAVTLNTKYTAAKLSKNSYTNHSFDAALKLTKKKAFTDLFTIQTNTDKKDNYYKYTMNSVGKLKITLVSNVAGNVQFALYKEGNQLEPVAKQLILSGSKDTYTISEDVTPGSYYIVVSSLENETGTYVVTVK